MQAFFSGIDNFFPIFSFLFYAAAGEERARFDIRKSYIDMERVQYPILPLVLPRKDRPHERGKDGDMAHKKHRAHTSYRAGQTSLIFPPDGEHSEKH